MRSGIISIVCFLIIIIGYSCKSHGGKDINEGEIHYGIEYGSSLGSVPREMLPKTLVVYFKKNKTLFEMVSMFGNSGISNLSNPEAGIYDTYFGLFSMRYYYAAEKGELFPGFDAMDGIEVKKTSKIMDICGFRCKNAEAIIPSDRNKIISIWYTDEIDVKGSNIGTPFNDIDGVLLDFIFYLGDTEVHFSAENIYSKEISDKTFERRANYKRVTKDELNKFINRMISL